MTKIVCTHQGPTYFTKYHNTKMESLSNNFVKIGFLPS